MKLILEVVGITLILAGLFISDGKQIVRSRRKINNARTKYVIVINEKYNKKIV